MTRLTDAERTVLEQVSDRAALADSFLTALVEAYAGDPADSALVGMLRLARADARRSLTSLSALELLA